MKPTNIPAKINFDKVNTYLKSNNDAQLKKILNDNPYFTSCEVLNMNVSDREKLAILSDACFTSDLLASQYISILTAKLLARYHKMI